MQIALIIYGSLDEVSGGFLYDRKLMEHLQQRGHEVTVLSMPWRSYGRSLVDNGSHRLLRRMQGQEFAVIVQDELIHPSVFQLNQRLRCAVKTPAECENYRTGQVSPDTTVRIPGSDVVSIGRSAISFMPTAAASCRTNSSSAASRMRSA